ncbi:hypothetical protein ACFFX0_03405 [Citricoccus parietis]|uniref:Uncharacterized protein n=1 Tax=Citricoccus parietis TaxID=592307 RepID=A0ABV5FUB9_9MICC
MWLERGWRDMWATSSKGMRPVAACWGYRRASVPTAMGRTTSNRSCASPVMRRRSVSAALPVSCRSCHRTAPR